MARFRPECRVDDRLGFGRCCRRARRRVRRPRGLRSDWLRRWGWFGCARVPLPAWASQRGVVSSPGAGRASNRPPRAAPGRFGAFAGGGIGLMTGHIRESSATGTGLAALSLVVLAGLSKRKRSLAARVTSRALLGEATARRADPSIP